MLDGVRASMELAMDAVMEADLRQSILDEVRADLGTGAAPDEHPGRPPVWGSVLIDEAQDISPMAWRMITRSCPNQAMTVVGDLAQGTRPWSPASWDEVVAWIDPRHSPRRHELHVNYRTPTEIMEWANPFSAAPDRARAIRSTGRAPTAHAVAREQRTDALLAELAELARDAPDTRTGVIAPPSQVEELAATVGASIDDPSVVVHTPDSAKGLEFDNVIVVEPGALAALPKGDAALYIALTRATSRLSVLHSYPLPEALAAVIAGGS